MSTLGKLLPLVLLFAIVGVFAWVGYQMYIFSTELGDRGKKHMEKKNINFTKDGMRVGVKEMNDEDYADMTQKQFVKAWNLSGADHANGRPSNSRSGSSSKPGKGTSK